MSKKCLRAHLPPTGKKCQRCRDNDEAIKTKRNAAAIAANEVAVRQYR